MTDKLNAVSRDKWYRNQKTNRLEFIMAGCLFGYVVRKDDPTIDLYSAYTPVAKIGEFVKPSDAMIAVENYYMPKPLATTSVA